VRRNRGVSELMAMVIMVGVVAIVGTATLLYSMNYFSGVNSAKEEYGALELNALEEDFLIVDAYSGGGVANVAIYNYGNREIEIVGMYVNGMDYNVSGAPIEIRAGETIVVNGSGATDASNLALIRVVSSSGNYYENVFRR
jgi:archaellum component FlaF (FlaF/FlaG flagellin family)